MSTPEYRLASVIEAGLRSDADIFITTDRGRYKVFGRFTVTPVKHYFVVHDSKTNESQDFTTLKNAFAWCTFKNSKKGIETRRIQSLDLRLYSLTAEIANQRRMLKLAKTPDAKLIHLTKLEDASFRRRIVKQEIEQVVERCKVIQTRKFDSPNITKMNAFDKYNYQHGRIPL
jgi:hypothetical protein